MGFAAIRRWGMNRGVDLVSEPGALKAWLLDLRGSPFCSC